ncbi:hypothetical protein PRZ48_013362 [Zasmidium cellare]|uniref:F-box domain-containing protein n=1 Tax=Zasmidium cellare TaxID=395010 RepID=A0ABR0E0U3_ZASCE|nr:hypothetical protein PRZ48_013362 [Zasmidium cellare]
MAELNNAALTAADAIDQGGRDVFTTIPNEVLNRIFQHDIIHRDHFTGEELPVKLEHFTIIARRTLRWSITCKKFKEIMDPMFFGQNVFAMKPMLEGKESALGELKGWPKPDRIDVDGQIISEFAEGTFANNVIDDKARRNGVAVARADSYYKCGQKWLQRQVMLIPTKKQRELIKNITITFEVTDRYVDRMFFDERRNRQLSEDCQRWFSILHSAAWLREFKKLDNITILLEVPQKEHEEAFPTVFHMMVPRPRGTFQRAKRIIKAHVDALLEPVKAEKKDIKWPAGW